MKKMTKKSKVNNVFSVLAFALIIGFLWASVPSVVSTACAETGYELDDKILALINPFISKLPPPPVEVKEEVIVSEPVPEPVITLPEPVIPPPPPKPVFPDLILSGTILSKDNPRAIVNGKVLGVGDMIEGVRIMAIMKGEIDAFFEGEHFLIRLKTAADKNKKGLNL